MTPVRGIVLDLFGTILDVGSLSAQAAAVASDPDAFVRVWREKQVSYMLESAATQRYEDFDTITGLALDHTAALLHIDIAGARDGLLDGWRRLRPYDDAGPALRDLGQIGLPLAVLTNATFATGQTALANAGLAGAVDTFMSVEPGRMLKPNPAAYEAVMRRYGFPAREFMFVTAAGWDAIGASETGMRVAWCNRSGAPPETFGKAPTWTIASMRELPAIAAELCAPT